MRQRQRGLQRGYALYVHVKPCDLRREDDHERPSFVLIIPLPIRDRVYTLSFSLSLPNYRSQGLEAARPSYTVN